MTKSDVAITTAKIGAFQAIAVALITGLLTSLTTLYATGAFEKGQGTGAPTVSVPAQSFIQGPLKETSVQSLPKMAFSARPTGLPLKECLQKARKVLINAGFSNINAADFYVTGLEDNSFGAIWCHTDARQLIFLSAAKEFPAAQDTEELLVNSSKRIFAGSF